MARFLCWLGARGRKTMDITKSDEKVNVLEYFNVATLLPLDKIIR